MKKGTIKFFSEAKQFGFIHGEEGDIFFHATEVPTGVMINAGAKVRYEVGENKKGPAAINVQIYE